MSSKLVSVPTVISLAQFFRQMASHFVKEIAATMQNSQLKLETVSRLVPESSGKLLFCSNEGHICTISSCSQHMHLHTGASIMGFFFVGFFFCISWIGWFDLGLKFSCWK